MAKGRDDIRMKIEMTGREYVDFLRKLATDDDFRARLEKDPVSTLAAHRIRVDPDDVPGEVQLPSKEALQETVEHLEKQGSDIAFIAFPMFLFPRS